MALFLIKAPTYVREVHMGAQATIGNPATITVPNDHLPSLTWEPLDEDALASYELAVEARAEGLAFGITDKARIEAIYAQVRKKYKKSIAKAPEPKQETKEVDTMSGMAAARGGKVVGRAADKSPV